MKPLAVLLVGLSLSATCHADCLEGAKAASVFMNEYKTFLDNTFSKRTKVSASHWIQRHSHLTASFKSSYKKVIEDAYKADPEMGLDADPILDAQDYPDKGFTVDSCDQDNYVTLKGVDWESFRVVVKTVSTKSGWKIDGAGIINMPSDKRARRD